MPLDMNDPMIKETLSVLENYKKEVEAKIKKDMMVIPNIIDTENPSKILYSIPVLQRCMYRLVDGAQSSDDSDRKTAEGLRGIETPTCYAGLKIVVKKEKDEET